MQLICAILLVLSCQTQEQDSSKGIYSDDFARGMARRDVDADIATGLAKGLQAQPTLEIVPAGETKSVKEIFAALNLIAERMYLVEAEPRNNVILLHWTLSPSYTLCIMTDARQCEALTDKTDLSAIEGYGVRIFAADQ